MKKYIPLEWENKYLKIWVYYDLWGMNYFNWQKKNRWLKINFRPVVRKDEWAFVSESYDMIDDNARGLHILDMKRDNKKTVDKYWDIVKSIMDVSLVNIRKNKDIKELSHLLM